MDVKVTNNLDISYLGKADYAFKMFLVLQSYPVFWNQKICFSFLTQSPSIMLKHPSLHTIIVSNIFTTNKIIYFLFLWLYHNLYFCSIDYDAMYVHCSHKECLIQLIIF